MTIERTLKHYVSTTLMFGIMTLNVVLLTSCANASGIPKIVNQQILNQVQCKYKDNSFEMLLASPTGDTLEDDITLWFNRDGKYVIANSGYIAFYPTSEVSICDKTAVFEVSSSIIAVPLFMSNRPDLDLLAVAVYDLQKNMVRTYEVIERYLGETPKLKAIKGGFSYLAVSAQPTDGPEGLEQTWLNVTWDGNKLNKI